MAATPYTAGDTLTVGSITYVFGPDIDSNSNNDITASNIASVVTNHPDVSAVVGDPTDTVIITADEAGYSGNNILLSSSNDEIIEIITPMSGGAPADIEVIINGRKDEPRNAIIQINFNEAVNPLTVSGDAVNVSPFIRVIDIDGVRIKFPNGWALVRASNTQPSLVLRYEADTPENLQKIRNIVEPVLHKVRERIGG